jgi:hypothetical protein
MWIGLNWLISPVPWDQLSYRFQCYLVSYHIFSSCRLIGTPYSREWQGSSRPLIPWCQIDKRVSPAFLCAILSKPSFGWKSHTLPERATSICDLRFWIVVGIITQKTTIQSNMNVSWRKFFLKSYFSSLPPILFLENLLISFLLLLVPFLFPHIYFFLLLFLNFILRLLILNIYFLLLFFFNCSFSSSDSCVNHKLVL